MPTAACDAHTIRQPDFESLPAQIHFRTRLLTGLRMDHVPSFHLDCSASCAAVIRSARSRVILSKGGANTCASGNRCAHVLISLLRCSAVGDHDSIKQPNLLERSDATFTP